MIITGLGQLLRTTRPKGVPTDLSNQVLFNLNKGNIRATLGPHGAMNLSTAKQESKVIELLLVVMRTIRYAFP